MNSQRPYGVPPPRGLNSIRQPIDPKAILRSRITRRNSQHQQMLAMQTAQVAMAQSAAQVNQTNMSNAYQQSQGQQRSSEVNPTASTSDVTRSNQNQNYFGNPIQIRGPIRTHTVQSGLGSGGPPTGPTGQIMIKMEPSWEEYNHTNNHVVVSQSQSQPQQTINVGSKTQFWVCMI